MEGNSGRMKYTNRQVLGKKRIVVSNAIDETTGSETFVKEVETETTKDYHKVLALILDCFHEEEQEARPADEDEVPALSRKFHRMFIEMAFEHKLPSHMVSLDASQAWLVYWTSNCLKVLEPDAFTEEMKHRVVSKLVTIGHRHPRKPDIGPKHTLCGPFGGGYGQLPHLAGTYASISAMALCENIGGCWDLIDRVTIYKWLLKLKHPDGGFKTCELVGEFDTRGVYCALSVASLLNILTDELTQNVVEYLKRCQNYEGGFGGTPYTDEAHGGYTFCAVASLAILGALDEIDIERLIEWCAARQCDKERGFCGRSNKLVDGCYSFWVGGVAAILEAYLSHKTGESTQIFDKKALRDYLLYCCQTDDMPGLRDKPGKRSDFYHTNYGMLGLAITESNFTYSDSACLPINIISKPNELATSGLAPINPIYGLPREDCQSFYDHFH